MYKRNKNENIKKSDVLRIDNEEYLKKKEALTSFFLDSNYVPMSFKQILNIVCTSKEDSFILESLLKELEFEGLIYLDESKGKTYILCEKNNIIKCIYQAKTKKFGFGLLVDLDDIYIPFDAQIGVMNNDIILVKIIKNDKPSGRSSEGKILKVLKRNTKKIVGRFIKNNNFGFVEPIDTKIEDIYISKKNSFNTKDGQMVEVEILNYATGKSKAEGKIISIIGDRDNPHIEELALYKSYNLDTLEKFSNLVLEEIKSIPDEARKEDKVGRIDKTNECIVTIDSEDAKDLDDAISVKKLDDGTYMLSVYIADVSHYVKEDTNLDKEAIKRGTSIYIPGTVIPMLPKKLSNGICSLNAGVERLALAVDMKIDKNGNVVENYVYKAVIKVSKKMSYEKVYKVLMCEDLEVLKEYKEYEQNIFLMKELAEILKKRRKEEGCIDFDIPDTKVILDEERNVVDIKPYDVTIANKIIEEFMLITNMTIAEKFYFLEAPFIYRIHEKPDEEKLRMLNEILVNYNKIIKGIKNIHPKALSSVIDEITDSDEKQIISVSMLRTLKMAKYSDECLGHFGLAAKYYCHFTSPIRRYPDLFIHRVISEYLKNDYLLSTDRTGRYLNQSVVYSKISSDMEKESTLIERDFDDLYKAIYMSKFIGEVYEARVSSVTNFGMFVKLDNTIEGLVPFEKMPNNDYYIYDEKKHILIGRRTGKTYKVGDKIKVKLIKSDVKSKQLDFSIV